MAKADVLNGTFGRLAIVIVPVFAGLPLWTMEWGRPEWRVNGAYEWRDRAFPELADPRSCGGK
jgi:hypothetical protein